MGKRSSEDTKGTVFVISCKIIFDLVILVGLLEGLAKIRRLHRGGSGEDFMMVDGRIQYGINLVKESGVLFKGGES